MIKPIVKSASTRCLRGTEEPFNIDFEMNRAYKKNESKIMSESIRPIGPRIYTNYNSLNIIDGSQGKGKSHIVLRDIIQISRLKNSNVHQIVYISKNGVVNDSTFEALHYIYLYYIYHIWLNLYHYYSSTEKNQLLYAYLLFVQ